MVKINDKEYKVKYSIRALFIWEQLSGKPFNLSTYMDNYVFYYSLLLASNDDFKMTFDEFIDATDNDSSIIIQIGDEISSSQKINSQFNEDEEGGSEEKKV